MVGQIESGGKAQGKQRMEGSRREGGGTKMEGELQATMRYTNEMMAGSLPSTQPRPIPFHQDKSATESKQSPPVSQRKTEAGRTDGQSQSRTWEKRKLGPN